MSLDMMNVLIGGFVFLIVGIILAGSIGDSVDDVSKQNQIIVNESVVASAGVAVSLVNDDLTGSQYVYNGTSGLLSATNYTIDADAGTFTLKSDNASIAFDGNTLNVDYTYIRNNYVADSTSRSFVSLTLLFFVIAVFGGAIYLGIEGFKKMGLL